MVIIYIEFLHFSRNWAEHKVYVIKCSFFFGLVLQPRYDVALNNVYLARLLRKVAGQHDSERVLRWFS